MEKKHGGARSGAGRKSKSDELKLIERLDSIINQDDVIEQLKKLILGGNINAIKLYMEYRNGKAKESVDVTTGGEQIKTIINLGGGVKPE